MSKNKLVSLFIRSSFLFIFIPGAISQDLSDSTEIDKNFDLVRTNFSGTSAFNTVAFVEKYWRIAGNSGFDSSIYYVADLLKQGGYKEEKIAEKKDALTYRIEKRPMNNLTWEPVYASLEIQEHTGYYKVLDFSTNRNMIAVNSWSTSKEGVEAELVYLDPGFSEKQIKNLDVRGKIVFAEQSPRRLYQKLVKEEGAIGLIIYSNPEYLQPSKNQNSIQFRSISQDTIQKSWVIATSYKARSRILKQLSQGPTKVRVKVETRLYQSEELTLVADIKGRKYPDERIVYSAHVQEPGANDNASGVGAQAEMAVVAAKLVKSGEFKPDRSLTFLFGDEILSTRRYIEEDANRAKGIKWGISLDMVGENTAVTGGTFLIEKMPDPSAIWTRGQDKHTEWGGSPLTKEQIKPHYFNDFAIYIFKKQEVNANWQVNTNPYEGGSDHVPFLRADIPGLLLWHFTDVYYHTDGDRIDKVSAETLQNVGIGALVTGMTLVNADKTLFNFMLGLLSKEANSRLLKEYELSKASILNGGAKEDEADILRTWTEYYDQSIQKVRYLIHPKDLSNDMEERILLNQKRIDQRGSKMIRRLK
jgi:hypothetical protein